MDADSEEGRLGVVGFKRVQDSRSELGMRTVIEGQADFITGRGTSYNKKALRQQRRHPALYKLPNRVVARRGCGFCRRHDALLAGWPAGVARLPGTSFSRR